MTKLEQGLLNDDELQEVSGGGKFASDEIRIKTRQEYNLKFKSELRREVSRQIFKCLFNNDDCVDINGALAFIEENKQKLSVNSYNQLKNFLNSINLV